MTYISIVEDLEDVARNIANQIKQHPKLTLAGVYTNGEAALEMIPGHRCDIVLMDIGLPGMNGIECMVSLKENNPSLDFLMFTVFDGGEELFDALKYGASGYILKSDGIMGTMKAIEQLRDGGAPMSAEIAKKVLASFRQQKQKGGSELLTPKQNEVLMFAADGLFNYEIADRMGISDGTIRTHMHAIFLRLHVNNRVEAINKYFKR